MNSIKLYNLVYTALMGAGVLAFFSQLLITYDVTSFFIKGLFVILIMTTFIGYIYSMGYLGGNKRNFTYSKNTNVKLIILVLLGLILEFETWLYLSGNKSIIIYVYIQMFAILLIAITYGILDKQRKRVHPQNID